MLYHQAKAFSKLPSEIVGLGRGPGWGIGRYVAIFEFDQAVLLIGRDAEDKANEEEREKMKERSRGRGGRGSPPGLSNINPDRREKLRQFRKEKGLE